MKKIFKRLFVGLLYIILMCTWFIWCAPYWVITGKDFMKVFIDLESFFNIFEIKSRPRRL